MVVPANTTRHALAGVLLTVLIILSPKYFYDLFLLVPVQNNGVEAETFLPNIYHPPSKQLEFHHRNWNKSTFLLFPMVLFYRMPIKSELISD
jgi:hypothetical protein